jgi:hypothetical protein
MRAGCLGRERSQTFAGADSHSGLLIVDLAGVWMPAYAKVLARPAAVLISNVAFADIARRDEDFLGRME